MFLSVILGPLVGRDGTAAEKSFYDNFNSSKVLKYRNKLDVQAR